MILGMLIIMSILLMRYKPVYAVKVKGESIGYIESKKNFSQRIEEITESEEENIAFISLEENPEYEWKLIDKSVENNESEVLAKLEETAVTTYVRYAIILNDETQGYAKTQQEAENMIEEIKETYEDKLDLELAVVKEYTEDLEEINNVDVEVAKAAVTQTVEEEERKQNSTVNGVVLASRPVTGIVSSRFGATNGRDHTHKGLDIAASTGTPIYACGDGVVTKAGWSNGYGNLVVIDHGNGVETYYGHCSKLLVTVGQSVSSGDQIALVGSTGHSTGPHLHLEIRNNGEQINPQILFYQ